MVAAHAPGSMFWGLAAVGVIWAVWSALAGSWRGVIEGALAAAIIVGVIRLLSGVQGWRFRPF
jgi:hypothetical protein